MINNEQFPKELDRFNWAAFLFNWIWGIFNGVPKALLALIPFFNIYWVFKLGFNANRWAWENGQIQDVQRYKKKQRYWLIGGVLFYLIIPIIFFTLIFSVLGNLKIVEDTFSDLKNIPEVTSVTGLPLTKSKIVTGGYHTTQEGFICALRYWVYGPNAEAEVYIEAFEKDGQVVIVTWNVDFPATNTGLTLVYPEVQERYLPEFEHRWNRLISNK